MIKPIFRKIYNIFLFISINFISIIGRSKTYIFLITFFSSWIRLTLILFLIHCENCYGYMNQSVKMSNNTLLFVFSNSHPYAKIIFLYTPCQWTCLRFYKQLIWIKNNSWSCLFKVTNQFRLQCRVYTTSRPLVKRVG